MECFFAVISACWATVDWSRLKRCKLVHVSWSPLKGGGMQVVNDSWNLPPQSLHARKKALLPPPQSPPQPPQFEGAASNSYITQTDSEPNWWSTATCASWCINFRGCKPLQCVTNNSTLYKVKTLLENQGDLRPPHFWQATLLLTSGQIHQA